MKKIDENKNAFNFFTKYLIKSIYKITKNVKQLTIILVQNSKIINENRYKITLKRER